LRLEEQPDGPPSIPKGFDRKTDEANRVADRAQQVIDDTRKSQAEVNARRKAEGKPPLYPEPSGGRVRKFRKGELGDSTLSETASSSEQAATVRTEELSAQPRPEAAPPPPTEDDAQLRAAYAKIPRVPIEGGAAAEEVAFQKWKTARADAGRDKTISVEDKSEKYSKDIFALANSSEDTKFIMEIHGKDSMLTAIQAASPTAYATIMNTLGGVIQASGQVVDMATPIIQALNKNEAAKNAINKVGNFLSPGRQVLTGDTDKDADRFGDALMATLESLDAMYMGGGATVSSILAAAPRRATTSGALRSVGLEKAADRFAKTGLRTRAAQAGKEAKSTQRKIAADARARARIEGLSPTRAMLAGSDVAEESSRLADEAAAANQDIAQQAIKEFEASLPKPPGWKEGDPLPSISMVNKRTKLLEIDPEKVRVLGKDRARQLYHAERAAELAKKYEGQPTKLQAALQQTEEAMAAGKFDDRIDALTNPLLNPDKFNHIIGIASDLKKASPDLWDDSKTVIDNLFDLTVQKKLTGEGVQEIADTLNKYGFSFDDYVMTIVGTGSEAGKVLNKLSQIRRSRPTDEIYEANRAAVAAMDGTLKNLSQRVENIRRGGMVSQIATAARNLTSAGIRMPLEALQNVAETAMYNFQHGGFRKGLGSVASSSTWKGAFKPFHHAFRNPREAKAYVDLILNKEELAPTYKRLFGNLNEIQMLTGRGQATTMTGKVVDSVLSVGEDAVMDLNIFNRLQEFTVRRAMFLGQLENLTKREYGIDLIEALNEGKLTGLLNDSMRPQGKRSFHELIEDSTRLALDVTYAKQPDTKMGKAVANWITNASFGPARATWVLPFPRFMMNSLELIGQYAGGASIPLTKKFISLMKGGKAHHAFDGIPEMGAAQIKLTTKDRQRISRNIAGVAAFTAAYQYRTMEDAPADYKMMKASDGTVVDTTPQFPMRQMLMVGEIAKQAMRGDIGEWLSRKNNQKELLETFLGTNIRTGTGAGLMTDLVEMVEGLGLGDVDRTDLVATEKAAKTLGRAIGGYAVSWLTPFVQLKEAQRWLGGEHLLGQEGAAAKWFDTRTQEYKDVAKDPELDAPFSEQVGKEIMRPLHARGFGLTAREERLLPERVRIGQPDDKRMFPGIKALTGLSFRKRDSADMEYLHNLGYSEWTEGSKSKVPTIRRFENAYIQNVLPEIVEELRLQETDLRDDYQDLKPEHKKDQTEDQYVRSELRPLTNDILQKYRSHIAKLSIAAYEGDDEALEVFHAQTAYRKLSKDRRKNALTKFRAEEGRVPNFTDPDDLVLLSGYGKLSGLAGR
tara:strand:- start:57 stop:3977 length:3921 start_codon:yes stop_codon:yes gene_type:complete